MKKIVTALAALALATPVFADEGAEVFKSKCASCHGEDGKGKTKMGEKLGVKDLAGTKADVVKTVTEGKPPKMQAYGGKLTDAQIKAVADHVKGLK
jgi:cbb3-type cytochrome c oxidase subunit III